MSKKSIKSLGSLSRRLSTLTDRDIDAQVGYLLEVLDNAVKLAEECWPECLERLTTCILNFTEEQGEMLRQGRIAATYDTAELLERV